MSKPEYKQVVGRRSLDGATSLKPYRVTLDIGTWLYLKALGNGQLSLGIRKAAKIVQKL